MRAHRERKAAAPDIAALTRRHAFSSLAHLPPAPGSVPVFVPVFGGFEGVLGYFSVEFRVRKGRFGVVEAVFIDGFCNFSLILKKKNIDCYMKNDD
jgi:hypothetical protein